MRGSAADAQRGVVLIGLRRSGKTSVGILLAKTLGRTFADLDALVERAAGMPVGELIRTRGEPWFREVERQAVEEALAIPGAVLASGGGTPTNEDCGRRLKTHGVVLYLRATPEELEARARADPRPGERPLLAGADAAEEIAALFSVRDPVFRDMADAVIDAEGSIQEVLARCGAAMQS